MGLVPLEFADCAADSPEFRALIRAHDLATEQTSAGIKGLHKLIRASVDSARQHSKLERAFGMALQNFQTSEMAAVLPDQSDHAHDDFLDSFARFGETILSVEEARDRLLDQTQTVVLDPLQQFRKVEITLAQESKKKFDRASEKYYQLLEKTMSISGKKKETSLTGADQQLDDEKTELLKASMSCVRQLNELEEKKNFMFLENILSYMYSYKTFLHEAYACFKDIEPYFEMLSLKIQNARDTFNNSEEYVDNLMKKTEELHLQRLAPNSEIELGEIKDGHMCIREKRSVGYSWVRYFCRYNQKTREFTTQRENQPLETVVVESCRLHESSVDRRFTFELNSNEKLVICQAPTALEFDEWVGCMTGGDLIPSRVVKEKDVKPEPKVKKAKKLRRTSTIRVKADEQHFVTSCITEIESRGLDEEGLYRLPGIASRVQEIVMRNTNKKPLKLADEDTKTLCSALKQYFRQLEQPIMTFAMHEELIAIAKLDDLEEQLIGIESVLHRLPKEHYLMLKELMLHLTKVAAESDRNKMLPSNIGVCFGPTLMRSTEESMAAILNMKYQNYIVELMIVHYERLFSADIAEWDENVTLDATEDESDDTSQIDVASTDMASSSISVFADMDDGENITEHPSASSSTSTIAPAKPPRPPSSLSNGSGSGSASSPAAPPKPSNRPPSMSSRSVSACEAAVPPVTTASARPPSITRSKSGKEIGKAAPLAKAAAALKSSSGSALDTPTAFAPTRPRRPNKPPQTSASASSPSSPGVPLDDSQKVLAPPTPAARPSLKPVPSSPDISPSSAIFEVQRASPETLEIPTRSYAIRTHATELESELSFVEGDLLVDLVLDSPTTVRGRVNGTKKTGTFPRNCIKTL